jgi:ribosomal protein S18 acetylase RimI-like enzyme
MLLSERNARVSDEDWLWRIYKSLLRSCIETQWGWDESFQVNEIFGKLLLSKFIIVNRNDVDVAAYLVYEEPEHYYLKMILVMSEYQGEGIGYKIIKDLQSTAIKNGKLIRLSVINSNPVCGFYENLGFIVVKRDEESTYFCWGL